MNDPGTWDGREGNSVFQLMNFPAEFLMGGRKFPTKPDGERGQEAEGKGGDLPG